MIRKSLGKDPCFFVVLEKPFVIPSRHRPLEWDRPMSAEYLFGEPWGERWAALPREFLE